MAQKTRFCTCAEACSSWPTAFDRMTAAAGFAKQEKNCGGKKTGLRFECVSLVMIVPSLSW